jgi:hypothetical protein
MARKKSPEEEETIETNMETTEKVVKVKLKTRKDDDAPVKDEASEEEGEREMAQKPPYTPPANNGTNRDGA